MTEVIKEPVITEKTARDILNAILSQNTGHRETRDMMAAQNEIMSEIKEYIKNGTESYYVPVLYDGSAYSLDGITFDDILKAYEAGKDLLLKITYGNKAYYANMVCFNHLSVPIQKVWSFQFYSITNPEAGKKGYYLINRTEKISSGTVTEKIEFSQAGFYASEVICDVTIGGTPYTTLDAALSAIVSAIEA